MKGKKPYPRNNDIADAILEVLSKKPYIHPDDLPDEVRAALEDKGFYAGLVSNKRIWRMYEKLVKSGKMYDVLMVMQSEGDIQM